jgi:hypothetical protein
MMAVFVVVRLMRSADGLKKIQMNRSIRVNYENNFI